MNTGQTSPVVEAPVTFGIALVSARVARDWPSVQRLLANTLRSLFRQTDQNFRIVIACHEPPAIKEVDEKRVTILPVDFPIPRHRGDWRRDIMRKHEIIGAKLREFGGGWLFILDADDLLANDLCARIRSTATKVLILASGYRLDVRRQQAQLLLWRFWRKCGSCIAVNWRVDELPEAGAIYLPQVFQEYMNTFHYNLKTVFDKYKWKYSLVHKPSVAYIVNHGQNLSDVVAGQSFRWRLYFRLTPWTPWTAALDRRFGGDSETRRAAIYSGSKPFNHGAETSVAEADAEFVTM
jgi:hypothetical protein